MDSIPAAQRQRVEAITIVRLEALLVFLSTTGFGLAPPCHEYKSDSPRAIAGTIPRAEGTW